MMIALLVLMLGAVFGRSIEKADEQQLAFGLGEEADVEQTKLVGLKEEEQTKLVGLKEEEQTKLVGMNEDEQPLSLRVVSKRSEDDEEQTKLVGMNDEEQTKLVG